MILKIYELLSIQREDVSLKNKYIINKLFSYLVMETNYFIKTIHFYNRKNKQIIGYHELALQRESGIYLETKKKENHELDTEELRTGPNSDILQNFARFGSRNDDLG